MRLKKQKNWNRGIDVVSFALVELLGNFFIACSIIFSRKRAVVIVQLVLCVSWFYSTGQKLIRQNQYRNSSIQVNMGMVMHQNRARKRFDFICLKPIKLLTWRDHHTSQHLQARSSCPCTVEAHRARQRQQRC